VCRPSSFVAASRQQGSCQSEQLTRQGVNAAANRAYECGEGQDDDDVSQPPQLKPLACSWTRGRPSDSSASAKPRPLRCQLPPLPLCRRLAPAWSWRAPFPWERTQDTRRKAELPSWVSGCPGPAQQTQTRRPVDQQINHYGEPSQLTSPSNHAR
jgi:hypothetical protein